jgi:hypothetical protein
MGKTSHYVICYSKQNKTKSLAAPRTQKENSKENTLLQEQKNKTKKLQGFHIARLYTLFFFMMGKCHEGHFYLSTFIFFLP